MAESIDPHPHWDEDNKVSNWLAYRRNLKQGLIKPLTCESTTGSEPISKTPLPKAQATPLSRKTRNSARNMNPDQLAEYLNERLEKRRKYMRKYNQLRKRDY